ncbi:hypothetical protein [Acinetobacter sp. WZC-1]|uniref:hypothetical protein n=1 Tax=Acinetobacter sp. WZC-1 TaxID=3459034 RepID=UPI00403DB721
MKYVSYAALQKAIESFSSKGNQPNRILIGYKTFARLKREDKFALSLEGVEGKALERTFRNIKIKIVPEKHYLEIE